MQMRTILISAFALVFALCAALGAFLLVGTPTQSPDSVGIVVLKQDVLRGTTITPEAIDILQVPKDTVPAGSFLKREDAVGRVVTIMMVKNDPLLESKVAAKGTPAGIEAMLEPGFRATAIPVVSVSAGVGGFILPGSYVDVIHVPNDAVGAAKTLLQMVKVLAVNESIDAPKENVIKEMRSVTLQVKPQESEQLSWAQAHGALSLSLRNANDKSMVDAKADEVDVVVAKKHLGQGKVLDEDDLELAKRPKALVPADAFLYIENAKKRVMAVNMYRGDLLVQSKLVPEGNLADTGNGGAIGGQQNGQPAPPPLPVIQIIRGQNRAIVTLYPRANVGIAPK